jgi:hypothetical protein
MRGDVRLSDLKRTRAVRAKLMNVKIPETTLGGIDTIAGELGCSKTDAVIALLNEGLDAFETRREEFPKTAKRRLRRGRPPKPL